MYEGARTCSVITLFAVALLPEEAHLIKQKKHRMCANMKSATDQSLFCVCMAAVTFLPLFQWLRFIGHLFLRQLLSTKVVGSVICELVYFDDSWRD